MAGPVDHDDWPFRAGDEIEGRYRILRPLQAGGVGVVYEAEHKWNGLRVALKVLFKRVGDHADRMRAEARTLAEISHPNVVPITDGGVTTELSPSNGVVWFTMPLLRGRNLRQELNEKGAFDLARALRFGMQIADGSAAAHAVDVVHRDLKPENVFVVAADDSVKILDFGVSKIRNKLRPAELRTTDRHRLLGTEAYMAPELLQVGASDARSDVYALGHILYEMLAGRHCWSEGPGPLDFPPKMELGLRQIYTPASPVRGVAPHVPEYVDRIVMRALAKEPGARQQSMKELSAELASALTRVGSEGPSIASVPRGPVLTERMLVVQAPDRLIPVRASGPVSIGSSDTGASIDAALVCGTSRFAADSPELSDVERGMRILAAVEGKDARFRGMLRDLAADMSRTPENIRTSLRRAFAAVGAKDGVRVGVLLHRLRKQAVERGWGPAVERMLTRSELVGGAALLLEPKTRSDTAESALSRMSNLDEDTQGFAYSVLVAFARTPIDSHPGPRGALLALALGSPSDSEVARAELAGFVLTAANAQDLGVEMQSIDLSDEGDEPIAAPRTVASAVSGATPTPAISMTTPATAIRENSVLAPSRRSRVSPVIAFGIAVAVAVVIAIAGLALKKPAASASAGASETAVANMPSQALIVPVEPAASAPVASSAIATASATSAATVPTQAATVPTQAATVSTRTEVTNAPRGPTARPEGPSPAPATTKERPKDPPAPAPPTAKTAKTKQNQLPASGL